MDRNPADIVALDLDLAGMHAAPHIEVERARRVDDARAAADRARRSVEGREEPIAEGLDLPPAKARDLLAQQAVVLIEQLAPAAVAELSGPLGRADDVGEQDGREDAVGLGTGARAGEEVLDLVGEGVDVAGPQESGRRRAARRTSRRGCCAAR